MPRPGTPVRGNTTTLPQPPNRLTTGLPGRGQNLPVRLAPPTRPELLPRLHRNLDRRPLEPELLTQLPLDEPLIPGIQRPGREEHEPRRRHPGLRREHDPRR